MHLCLVAVLVLDGTQLYQHGKIGQEEFLLGFGGDGDEPVWGTCVAGNEECGYE